MAFLRLVRWCIQCDDAGCGFQTKEFTQFADAVEHAKRNGWLYLQEGGKRKLEKWYCPGCRREREQA